MDQGVIHQFCILAEWEGSPWLLHTQTEMDALKHAGALLREVFCSKSPAADSSLPYHHRAHKGRCTDTCLLCYLYGILIYCGNKM